MSCEGMKSAVKNLIYWSGWKENEKRSVFHVGFVLFPSQKICEVNCVKMYASSDRLFKLDCTAVEKSGKIIYI